MGTLLWGWLFNTGAASGGAPGLGVHSLIVSECELGWDRRNMFIKSWCETSQKDRLFWILLPVILLIQLFTSWRSWAGPQTQAGRWKVQGGSAVQGFRGSKGGWIDAREAVVWEWVGEPMQRQPLMWISFRPHLSQSYGDFPMSQEWSSSRRTSWTH